MGIYCDRCEESFFDPETDRNFYKDLEVCDKCLTWFEENDGETGKLIVVKCKECGTVKDWSFKKYEYKGRKPGSKNKPKDGRVNTSLLTFTNESDAPRSKDTGGASGNDAKQ